MAWNQPGKGKQRPLGRARSGGGGIDASSQRAARPLRRRWQARSAGCCRLLALLLLFNSFKLVDERQRGVVLRFGKFDRIMTPGANFKWPWPIETVTIVDATKIEIARRRGPRADQGREHRRHQVQRPVPVSDPRLFLFGFRDDLSVDGRVSQGRETLQNAAESAVREVVGNNTMDTVLFERSRADRRRAPAPAGIAGHVQDRPEASPSFTLQNARPPEEVKPAFDDAISAREDKNRIESEAQAYASKIVPEARGAGAAHQGRVRRLSLRHHRQGRGRRAPLHAARRRSTARRRK